MRKRLTLIILFLFTFPAYADIDSSTVSAWLFDSNGNAISSSGGSLNVNSTGTVTITGTITANQGTSPWVDNITQFGGNNVVTGTGASGVGIPRVTISSDSNVLATQSGTWTVQQGSPPWSVSQSGTWNLGNISGTVSLPTGAATSALQTTGNTSLSTIATNTTPLAQGSTTSGQSGYLELGAVTTSAPTYTTAQTSPLSLNTSGGLRVDGSGVTQPVSGTVTANQGGTWNLNNITGTVSLPTGAALNSELVTINTTLGSPFQAGGSIGNTTFASTQSGTWTVQPGNTANTTAWLVTGTGGTFPATESGTWNVGLNAGTNNVGSITNITGTVSLPTGASTAANQTAVIGPVGAGTAALNSLLTGAVYNTSSPAPTNGQQVALQANASGSLKVDGSAVTQPVSGTVTANAGTGTFAVSDAITHTDLATINTTLGSPFQAGGSIGNTTFASTQSGTWNINNVSGTVSLPTGAATSANQTSVIGSASGGTGATSSLLTGGQYNSTLPTLTNAQQAAIQLDSSGRAIVSPLTTSSTINVAQSTSPWVNNISQFGGANVVTGTGVSGSGIPRVTVANDSNVLATQSGTWNLNNISGTVSLPTGAATSANQTNGSQKTQLVDALNNVVGPIQTISGTNYQPVVLAASATPGSALVSRSIQIAGSDGTNAQTISTNSSGQINLNNISGTVSLPTGAATSANQTNGNQITQLQVNGAPLAYGQQLALASIPVVTQQDAAPATQNVTTQDLVTTSTSVANGQLFYTGTPTTGSAASFSLSSFEAIEVQVTGTWTGTLQTEVSMDGGTTWLTRGVKQSGNAYTASSFTANFEGGLNAAGINYFRVRAVAAMTGTATVKVIASVNPASLIVSNPQLLRDSNTQSITNTIKASSTAAVTTDTALVTALSPNTSLPSGTNSLGTVGLNAGSNNIGSVNQGTSPWVNNVSQFGGSNVVTGTGASGSGIPRVTVSNDSNVLATQSGTWSSRTQDGSGNAISSNSGNLNSNLTQVGNTNISTGTGASGAGIPRVTVSNDSNVLATQSGTWTMISNQGTANTVSNGWPVKLTDGTNTTAVKAASTAPTTSDPAAVVTLSPNSTLPPPSDLTVTGTLTSLASAPVVLNLNGTGSVNVDVYGSGFVGTIVVQEMYSSSARNLSVLALNSSATTGNITTNGNYRVFGVPASGNIQVLFSSYTSGSATITIHASTAPFYSNPMNFNAANLLTTTYLNDGSGNAISSNSGNLNSNLTQVGGTNISTGTGASGAGIPRVTVANDSNVLVTQSTSPWVDNVSQFGGTNVSTGTGASGAGIPRVTVSNDSNILATQSGTWSSRTQDGSGNVIGSSQNSLYVAGGWNYKNITTTGTTVIKSGAGLLNAICFNNVSTAPAFVLYDNTAASGTIIGTFTGSYNAGVGSSYTWVPQCQQIGGAIFSTGLTINVTTAGNITIYYK